jgi:hypothetical protein
LGPPQEEGKHRREAATVVGDERIEVTRHIPAQELPVLVNRRHHLITRPNAPAGDKVVALAAPRVSPQCSEEERERLKALVDAQVWAVNGQYARGSGPEAGRASDS